MTISAKTLLEQFNLLDPDEQESVGREVLKWYIRRLATSNHSNAGLICVLERLLAHEPTNPTSRPASNEPRPLGLLHGQITIPDDFDDPLPDDLLRAFEGDK